MLAAVVVVVALIVVLVGALVGGRSGGGPASLSLTGAPTAESSAPAASPSSVPSPVSPVSSAAGSSSAAVIVHVAGAVERPGVVSLGVGSRVSAAIDRAGGATTAADLGRLNLARVVVDGERLYVPKVGETDVPAVLDGSGSATASGDPGDAADGSTGSGPEAVIDLNAADRAALETLPGIGPALADRIIAWRDEHGRFSAVEDLLDVTGIGDGRFADLRDRVRV